MISERTGESMVSLKKRMEDGGVSAKELSQAFEWATDKQGIFYQGAEKASATFAGKVSNLKDAFSEGLIAIYEELKPVLMPILEGLITGVGKMTNVVVGGFKLVKTGLGWVWDKFKEGNPIILALTAIVAGFTIQAIAAKAVTIGISAATSIWTGAQWLLNAAMTANPIGLIIAGIVALIALIAYVIYRYEGWGVAWENLISYLDYSWQGFKQSFTTIWLQTEDFFLSGIEKLKIAWLSFKSLWDEDGAKADMAKIADNQQKRMDAIAKSKGLEDKYSQKAEAALSGVKLTDTGKTFKDVLKDVKGKIGISSGGASGAAAEISEQNSKNNASDAKLAKEAAQAGVGRAKGINQGGNRPISINITIQKLQDQLIVNAGNLKDAAKQAGTDVVNEILMLLQSVDQKAGGAYE